MIERALSGKDSDNEHNEAHFAWSTGFDLHSECDDRASRRATAAKTNIVVIWGDDIGYWNISAYNQGMMGYKTPNIDRCRS